jgi:hypothetical protein
MFQWVDTFLLSLTSTPKEAGYLLYRMHITGVFLLPTVFLFVSFMRIPILCFWIPVFIYHLRYRKCPITKIERRLHGEDITVLDPVLQLIGIPVTRESRDFIHVTMSSTFMSVIGLSYFFKFP